MFKRIEQILKNRMERWTERQLVICKTCLLFIFYLLLALLFIPVAANRNSALRDIIAKVPTIVYYLSLIIIAILIFVSASIFSTTTSVYRETKAKKEEVHYFGYLKKMLSTTEFREVLYTPHLRTYIRDSIVLHENNELKHSLELLRGCDVTHYAILVDSYVYIISKNKEGKEIGNRTMGAEDFCENYKVIKKL